MHNVVLITKSLPVLEIQKTDPNSELFNDIIACNTSLYFRNVANLLQLFATMEEV